MTRKGGTKSLNFIPAVQSGFKNYVNFEGRACRSEYWYFLLFTVLAYVLLFAILWGIAKGAIGAFGGHLTHAGELLALVTAPPGLALAVRRTHDLNLSGWYPCALWVFIGVTSILVMLLAFSSPSQLVLVITFVAEFIATFILLIAFCRRGTVGPNRFGQDRLAELTQQAGAAQVDGGTPGAPPVRRLVGRWWLAVVIWGGYVIWYEGFHSAILYRLATTGAYHLAVSVVQKSPVVIGKLGAPVTVSKPDGGTLNIELGTSSGVAVMRFPIRGPKAAGHISLEAVKRAGVWALPQIQLHVDSQTQR
jgi:uncharacterized membrane protein YhaH (DUF805 family)